MPSLIEIGPPGPEKKIFERFLPYTLHLQKCPRGRMAVYRDRYGHGSHLGHVTWIIYIYIG